MKKNILSVKFISLAFINLAVFSYSQKKLETDKNGNLIKSEYSKLQKEKGYDGISQFDTISLHPVLVYASTLKNNQFGIIDIYGKEILKNEYQAITGMYKSTSPLPEFHDHFFLQKDYKWAIADNYGKIITPFIYETLIYEEHEYIERPASSKRYRVSIYKDSIFKARTDASYIFLNTKGEKIQHTQRQGNDRLQFRTKKNPDNYGVPKNYGIAKPLSDNLFEVSKDEKLFGLYDKSLKKLILPVEFTYVALGKNVPFLSANKAEGTYAYDMKGNLILKEPTGYFLEGGNKNTPVIIVNNLNKKAAIYSKSFKPLTDFIYDRVSPYNYFLKGTIEGKTPKEAKTVLMNLEGKPIKFNVAPEDVIFRNNSYDDVNEAFITLRKTNKLAIVNNQGKVISDFIYDEIIPECFVAPGKSGIYEEYFMTANHPNHFIYFKKDNKYGIMDNDYNVILNNTYDMITESMIDNFIYIAKRTSTGLKWGVYNVAERKEIIAPQFDDMIKNSENFFIVNANGKYGIYNIQGKEVLPVQYSSRLSVDKLFNGMYSFYEVYKQPFAYLDSLENIIKVHVQSADIH